MGAEMMVHYQLKTVQSFRKKKRSLNSFKHDVLHYNLLLNVDC